MKLEFNIPDNMHDVALPLKRFVDAMIHKLGRNRHKGRWADLNIYSSLTKMEDEVRELHEAITDKSNTVEVLLEAADVANFAMIISSIAIERLTQGEPDEDKQI